MGVSKKSVSWTSTFVTTVLQENECRSDVTLLVQTFWTHPNVIYLFETQKEDWLGTAQPRRGQAHVSLSISVK